MISTASETIFGGLIALGVAGLVVDSAVELFPDTNTHHAFQVHSITATRQGNTAVLDVDRTINYPITMGFTVRVLEDIEGGLREFCRMESPPFEYIPNSILPDVLDLDWWTYGKCSELPKGRAVVSTTWTPQKDGYDAVTYTFEVE